MSFTVAVNRLVQRAIFLAAGLFVVIFFVIRAINSGVMYFAIVVDRLVNRAVMRAGGFPAVVRVMISTINSRIAAAVMIAPVVSSVRRCSWSRDAGQHTDCERSDNEPSADCYNFHHNTSYNE